jgi:hypothetical protein
MTIEGARRRLRQEKAGDAVKESPFLEEIKNELREVMEILS